MCYAKLGNTWHSWTLITTNWVSLGNFYFDTVLPMGASSSISVFESFSKALQLILNNVLGVSKVSHITDDFVFVGPAGLPKDKVDNLRKLFFAFRV